MSSALAIREGTAWKVELEQADHRLAKPHNMLFCNARWTTSYMCPAWLGKNRNWWWAPLHAQR